MHNIDVRWKECPHCDYNAKTNDHLTKHKASVHDIGVKWKPCSFLTPLDLYTPPQLSRSPR